MEVMEVLVGCFNHLENMKVNGKDYPIEMENKTCSKPPTSIDWCKKKAWLPLNERNSTSHPGLVAGAIQIRHGLSPTDPSTINPISSHLWAFSIGSYWTWAEGSPANQDQRTHMKPQLVTTCLPALNWIFESSSNGSWKAPRKQIIMFHFTAVGTRRGAPCRRRWCSSEATIPALFQVIHSQAFSTIKHSQVVSQLGPHCKSSSIPKPSQGKACQSLSFPS